MSVCCVKSSERLSFQSQRGTTWGESPLHLCQAFLHKKCLQPCILRSLRTTPTVTESENVLLFVINRTVDITVEHSDFDCCFQGSFYWIMWVKILICYKLYLVELSGFVLSQGNVRWCQLRLLCITWLKLLISFFQQQTNTLCCV